MRALRGRLLTPIADDDRRRAFAAAALALLLAAIALTLAADPPSRPAAVTDESPATRAAGEPVPATRVPAPVLSAARRFVDGYLAALRGARTTRGIPGASASLRHRLAAQPIRVSPSTRRHRARVVHLDGHRFGGGWLVDAGIATGGVRFPISLMVAERGRGGVPVVTRLVGD